VGDLIKYLLLVILSFLLGVLTFLFICELGAMVLFIFGFLPVLFFHALGVF